MASLIAQETVKLVGNKRTDRVMLVGHGNIELLIEFAERGFVDVTCRAELAGPNAGDMAADIIIVPGTDRDPDMAAVLRRLGRALRPDGVLLMASAGSPLATRQRRIEKLLMEHGFVFARTLF